MSSPLAELSSKFNRPELEDVLLYMLLFSLSLTQIETFVVLILGTEACMTCMGFVRPVETFSMHSWYTCLEDELNWLAYT